MSTAYLPILPSPISPMMPNGRISSAIGQRIMDKQAFVKLTCAGICVSADGTRRSGQQSPGKSRHQTAANQDQNLGAPWRPLLFARDGPENAGKVQSAGLRLSQPGRSGAQEAELHVTNFGFAKGSWKLTSP
ncbi:hypothetical protein [Hoeflea sp.]|uniref:hypothetical protein n=1 Tax=Hoeflea sp. TaxID=1940281 RepID=UPI003A8E6206